jgi:type IV secretion system protein VirB4
MLNPRRDTAIRREFLAADRIPYDAHVAAQVIRTKFGDYLQAFRLAGTSFECNDDLELNLWHERLNVLWRNIASPQVALWTHVVRRRVRSQGRIPEASIGGFADSLEAKYRRRLREETLMCNEIYLAVLFRPARDLGIGPIARFFARSYPAASKLDLSDGLEACEKLAQMLRTSLARYEPETLGVYRRDARWFSSLAEYLALLVNGEWQPIPLPQGPLASALASSRLFFGHESIEYRTPTDSRVGAMLGIKEYPSPTAVGMFGALLCAPFAFVLTQSFAFLSKATGQALLQRQYNRMSNAGDFAVSQADALHEALDALSSNDFVIGDHHFSLQVLADIESSADSSGAAQKLRRLGDSIASARSLLADTGMLVAREDLALEAAFWAQLPGNFAMRPRRAPITSRNFSGMAPFHNYPTGRAKQNHWGDALAVLVTSAGSPYYFSLHASAPGEEHQGGRRDTGHTLICGPTGSGKTVFIGFLITLLSRQTTTQVIFDKDRGLEILVRALGGEYFALRTGVSTGFNPLQLAATPGNIEFLKVWLRELGGAPSGRERRAGGWVREQADLDQALRGTLALEPTARRLSRLVEFLDPTDPEGLHARLARWCSACGGEYAQVFDNPADSVVPRLTSHPVIGFDVTEFLGNDVMRAPLTLYLFHLVRTLLDGRRLVCWMDEFWRLVADPAFAGFAKDAPKTWRKLNGVIALATQSASDVLESPISRTLVEQTPTKVFFPNGEANFAEYTQGFGLTEREFRLVKEQLQPGSRSFLVKQGQLSVVCELDLRGFSAELAVISGRISEIERMHRLIVDHGPDPARWLPEFTSAFDDRQTSTTPSKL